MRKRKYHIKDDKISQNRLIDILIEIFDEENIDEHKFDDDDLFDNYDDNINLRIDYLFHNDRIDEILNLRSNTNVKAITRNKIIIKKRWKETSWKNLITELCRKKIIPFENDMKASTRYFIVNSKLINKIIKESKLLEFTNTDKL